MNSIFFGLKRAYHGTLRVFRRALSRLGLTAARFDLLYIVHKDGGLMLQREVQRALGVAASTVSRMLASLEELGLVEREPTELDARRIEVSLTREGLRRVLCAAHLIIQTGGDQLAVDSALCPDHWHDPKACRDANQQCAGMLERIRLAYRDLATPDYPYPEECELDLPASFGKPGW